MGLSAACYLLSALVLASGLVVNPWAGRLYRAQSVNYEDVMLGYFFCSVGLAALLALCGFLLTQHRTERRVNLSVLATTVALLVLADRMVLAWVGLPYWIVDPEIHYRHRPGVTRTWLAGNPSTAADLGIGDRLIHFNAYGHHDDDFPREKPAGEFRGLLIGDSIVMGHGVDKDEAFTNRLEGLLRDFGGGHSSYQIINTGVQGYATSQELRILEESLAFDPDFIAIGFAVNDVTRPFRRGAETTTAPHLLISQLAGVSHASTLLRYALNETGFGRLVQVWRQDIFRQGGEDSWTLEVRALSEAERDDPGFREGWDIVLSDLKKMYGLARERGIPVVLLIFPETHQLFAEGMQKPQEILLAHAREQGVDCIDLAGVVEQWLRRDLQAILARTGRPAPAPEIRGRLYRLLADYYFMDPLHLTVEGHGRVAAALAGYLADRGLVELDRGALARLAGEVGERAVSTIDVSVPVEREALLEIGTALHALGRYEVAVMIYEKGLARFPQALIRARLFKAIGDARADQGRAKEARAAYGKAVEFAHGVVKVVPTDGAVRHFLGLVHLSAGQPDQAAAVFGPEVGAEFYFRLGVELFAEGKLEPAAKAYRAALTIDDTHSAARVNLGRALFARGDITGAVVQYRQVLDQGNNITAWFKLALALLAGGDVEVAKSEYARGIERFGAARAHQIGAADDLRDLAARGVESVAARDILRTYW